jgi:spermidine synthase
MPLALVRIADQPWLELSLSSGFSPLGNLLLAILLVPPSALVASLLPLLVARVRLDCRGTDSFAALYAANTAGSVAGSIAAGFLLIPLLGSAGALLSLVATSLALAAHLLRESRAGRRIMLPWALAALTCALLLAAVDVPRDVYRARIPEGTEILDFREGRHSDVMVTENEQGVRRLWINSSWVAGTGGGHRSLGHLPALMVERPRRLLGIALGTGQTFASVFAHGAETFDCVELDDGVIRLSTRWFAEANGQLFERPGVRLHHDDGRAFLRATDQRYGVIVLEPLQAWSAGTSSLYSREFYEEAARVLAPGGVLAQWIPFYGQGVDETRAMVRTARQVFPEASLWLDDHDGILLLQREPFELQPAMLSRRLHERGLLEDLARNGFDTMPDLLSLFVMGPRGLDAWQAGAEILEDDRPFLEFAAARELGKPQYHAILGSMRRTADPALDYVRGGTEDERLHADLSGRIRSAILGARLATAEGFAVRAGILEQGLFEAPESKLIRRRYRNEVLAWAQSLEAQGRGAETEQVYRRALEHDPSLGEAAVNLSILYARAQNIELARETLDRAWSSEPLRSSARQVLALLDDLERQN